MTPEDRGKQVRERLTAYLVEEGHLPLTATPDDALEWLALQTPLTVLLTGMCLAHWEEDLEQGEQAVGWFGMGFAAGGSH